MYKFALAASFFILAFAVTIELKEGPKAPQPALEVAGHFQADANEASMQHLSEASGFVDATALERR